MDVTQLLTRGLVVATLFTAAASAQHQMLGGDTTIVIPKHQASDRAAFSFPADNLSLTRRGDHFAGNSFFQNAWVTAPASVKARDGLGPVFNTMSCQSCHIRDGRGRPPRPGEDMVSMLVRISVPDPDGSHTLAHGVLGDPVYGDQLQNGAIAGVVPEARVELEWEEVPGRFEDGTEYSLRRPRVVLTDLAYGDASDELLTSPRVAPALVGIGLLDTIAEADLAAHADPDDADGDGISGRFNRVWDVAAGEHRIGRFGWKAEQPNVHQQAAAAFNGDIGITSSLFPNDALTDAQRRVVDATDGGSPEVDDEILELVTFYCKTLAVPAQRGHDDPLVLEGKRHFDAIGCVACHVDTFVTADDPEFPELSDQTIHPYTDLLLHDMGEGLADNRPVFAASGREWRTPPLWGMGLVYLVNRHENFLHDGRARSIEEAILWHGGEAQTSADAYRGLSADERRAVLAFLRSL